MYLVENEKMLTLRGTGNMRGSAAGKTKYLGTTTETAHSPAGEPRRELARLEAAKEKSRAELSAIYRELLSSVGESGAWVFLLQLFILQDDLFSYLPHVYIVEGKSAHEAILLTSEYFSKRLVGKSAFFSEIVFDVCDVAKRLLKNLDDKIEEETDDDDDAILLTKGPLPSEIYRLHSHLLGLVSDKRTEHSSTAALVRSLGIPAIYTSDAFSEDEAHKNAIIDSGTGALYINPDIGAVKSFSEGEHSARISAKLGRRPLMFAEPENLFDAKRLSCTSPDGIGPVGSEELYLRNVSTPDEEMLFEEYRSLAELFISKPIIIRALAGGGTVKISKLVSDEGDEKIELYVTEDKTLKSQLRAVMRAAVYGELLFALPSSLSYAPLCEAQRIRDEALEELKAEGRESAHVKLGIIIDTASQLLMGDKLLSLCDFALIKRKSLVSSSAELGDNEIEKDAVSLLLKSFSKSAKKAGKLAILSLDHRPSDDELKKFTKLGFGALTLPSSNFDL